MQNHCFLQINQGSGLKEDLAKKKQKGTIQEMAIIRHEKETEINIPQHHVLSMETPSVVLLVNS